MRILLAPLALFLSSCAGLSGGYVHYSDPTTRSGDTTIDGLNIGAYFTPTDNTELHVWLGPRWVNRGEREPGATVLLIYKVEL